MKRKLLLFLAMITVVLAIFGAIDKVEAKRRRELWAEATD